MRLASPVLRSSANLTGLRLNGTEVPEAGLSAAIAGHFGVPIVMISGDDVAVAETQALLGPVEGAVVKRAIGFHSAATMTPQAARALRDKALDEGRTRARDGVRRHAELRPYRVQTPVQLEVVFKSYRAPEILSYLPIVERPTSHSIRFTGADMPTVSRFLQFISHYEPGMAP